MHGWGSACRGAPLPAPHALARRTYLFFPAPSGWRLSTYAPRTGDAPAGVGSKVWTHRESGYGMCVARAR
jgi:hypothetical protein